jgi:hypothetical protein
MPDSYLADALRAQRNHPSWLRELVQARAQDVVLAASLFKPNAAGSYELTTSAGFGQRQILKADGAYFGERVVLGVTPLDLHALLVFFGGRWSRTVACWPRSDIAVSPVPARGKATEASGAAVLLRNHALNRKVELQALHDDEDTQYLLRLLVACHPAIDSSEG